MSTRRAVIGLLTLGFSLLASAGGLPLARAQSPSPSPIRLVLRSQTSVVTPAQPIVKITVGALNGGQTPVGSLSLGIAVGENVTSLTAYESSLTAGPGLPIKATAIPVAGTLNPAGARDIAATIDMSTIPGSGADSFVYPLRVDLRSDGEEIAGLNSAIIEIVRNPEVPLRLGWTFEVSAPIAFDPQGSVSDPSFPASIGAGGRLQQEVAALDALAAARVPVDIAVQPALLEQLSRMTDGYQLAGGEAVPAGQGGSGAAAVLLASLKTAAAGPATQLTSQPFASPSLPGLISSGLGRDLGPQTVLGRETLQAHLGVTPNATVTRPPTGALDEPALRALIALGTSIAWANEDTVSRPPQPNGFAPPPVATVAEGGASMSLILPDPNVQAMIDDPTLASDPVRAAQVTLGELATIWREEPVPPGGAVRGVALTVPASMPPGFWGPFANRIAGAPFLTPVTADGLVRQVPAPTSPVGLAPLPVLGFSRPYAGLIRRARRDVDTLRSMVLPADPQPAILDRNLFLAEAAQYVGNENAGRPWIDGVLRTTGATFARVLPDTSKQFTFTSRSGTIPIAMGDPGAQPLRVSVQLQSARLTFPDGDTKTVLLTHPNQVVSFSVQSTASGSSPVRVIVRSPSGRVVGQETLSVRSTAVNTIALAITLGAALVLVALWARRWFKRPTAA